MLGIIRKLFVQITLFSVLLAGTQNGLACGPFSTDPVFGFTRHGEYPLTEYAKGKTGLIPASYGRISLYVYYRYLNDSPFNDEEQKEVARAITNRIGDNELSSEENTDSKTKSPVSVWLDESKAIRPLPSDLPEQERRGSFYNAYVGCLDDAYLTAAKTLRQRIKSGYAKSDIADWVRGQDAVFSNCSENGLMPAETSPSAPNWLQKDRAYQSAAALFYQEKLADARNAFELISADNSSVWSKTSNYLIARTFIREASFIDTKNSEANEMSNRKNELLASAAGKLNEIINEPGMVEFHNSANNLLGLVKYRLNPEERTVELAKKLADSNPNRNIYNDLTDYIWLLDKIELKAANASEKSDSAENSEWATYSDDDIKLRDVPSGDREEDLTDWLITYQAPDGYTHALEMWDATKKVHWLAAAIIKANSTDAAAAELIEDADKLMPGSPAFDTAMYHAIRISLESGNTNVAARLTDKVFARGFDGVPTATKNSFYAQRIPWAKDLTEFLRYSKRTPTSFLWSDDFNESGAAITEGGGLPDWKDRQMFGEDAVRILNTSAPLNVWLDSADNKEVPDYLRDFIASAGWMRAFFLKDAPAEARFAELMQVYSKDYSPQMRHYYAAKNPRDREAAALIAIGRYPVLEPSIPANWGRKTSSPTTIYSYRGNWWCLDRETESSDQRPGFLSVASHAQGRAEYDKLRALGEGSTAFASRAVAFAKRNPRHRKSPEILHLAVRATRYGCTDENSGRYSKEAFELLHTRYRGSYWAKRTPFWFA